MTHCMMYLISETGAAETDDPLAAATFEHKMGYRRCTKEEYQAQLRRQQYRDRCRVERQRKEESV